MLQCVHSVHVRIHMQSPAVYCSILQYIAVCCSILQYVAVCCSMLQYVQYVAVCCRMLPYVAVCCSVLSCVAACCIMLQSAAMCCSDHMCAHVQITCKQILLNLHTNPHDCTHVRVRTNKRNKTHDDTKRNIPNNANNAQRSPL